MDKYFVHHRNRFTFFLVFIMLLFFSSGLHAASLNLSGTWQDNSGARYQIRQIANEIFWRMDDMPRVVNVFHGFIAGDRITGDWADLPGGALLGNGSLALRIESADRLVKAGETGTYGASVWTRVSPGAAQPAAPSTAPAASSANLPLCWDCLGTTWHVQENGWQGKWMRRFPVNIFDAYWIRDIEWTDGVLIIYIQGNSINITRQDSDGATFSYKGTLSADGRQASGTALCDDGTSYTWSATIEDDK